MSKFYGLGHKLESGIKSRRSGTEIHDIETSKRVRLKVNYKTRNFDYLLGVVNIDV